MGKCGFFSVSAGFIALEWLWLEMGFNKLMWVLQIVLYCASVAFIVLILVVFCKCEFYFGFISLVEISICKCELYFVSV